MYDSKFTASYYLSKTTRWGSVWGDIQGELYKRIGYFLTDDERRQLLEAEYSEPGVIDSWWDADKVSSIDSFFRTLHLTESRFLEQDGLFLKIDGSEELRKLSNYALSVIAKITNNDVSNAFEFKNLPSQPVDNVPIDWFKASEIVLFNQQGILNQNTVKLLGTDAWRQFKLQSISN